MFFWPNTYRQTNLFNFFHMTLPKVEGIYIVSVCEYRLSSSYSFNTWHRSMEDSIDVKSHRMSRLIQAERISRVIQVEASLQNSEINQCSFHHLFVLALFDHLVFYGLWTVFWFTLLLVHFTRPMACEDTCIIYRSKLYLKLVKHGLWSLVWLTLSLVHFIRPMNT